MALTFAITSTGGYGVLQSVEKTETADIADARGADGKVTDSKAYSKTTTVKADGLFNGDSLGGAGTSLTVATVTGLIKTITKSESNTDYQKVSVEIEKKDSATQVALS